MAKKAKKRSFEGKRKGVSFTHETTQTNAEAIEKLNAQDSTFAADCAFAIAKMERGMKYRENLVAWGFRLADEPPSRFPVRIDGKGRITVCVAAFYVLF